MRRICIVLIMAALLLSGSLTAYAQTGAAITLNDQTEVNSGTESVDAVTVDWGAASPAMDTADTIGTTEDGAQSAPSSYSPTQSGYGFAVGIYPQNVETVTENGVTLIKKTYEVSPDVNPEMLVQPFEQDGYLFAKREILRRDLPVETLSRLAYKTADTDTDSDDAALIARQFPGLIEHEEDGYTGQLQLDASTMVTQAADYETYSYAYTKTQEYSGLDRNDPAYIDRQMGGMTLSGVSFKQGAGGLYTGVATYRGTATGKRATGYVTTVSYFGTLTKEIPGNILYTVVCAGVPIETEPLPADGGEQDQENVSTELPAAAKEDAAIIPLSIAIVCIVSGGLSLAAIVTVCVPSLREKFMKKKEEND